MIFRRLQALGADWMYHFPELYFVKLAPPEKREMSGRYDVSASAANTLKAWRDRA